LFIPQYFAAINHVEFNLETFFGLKSSSRAARVLPTLLFALFSLLQEFIIVFIVIILYMQDEDDEMSDEIEHEDTCAVCGEEGDLAECSSCVSAFHLDCHDPPMRHIPR